MRAFPGNHVHATLAHERRACQTDFGPLSSNPLTAHMKLTRSLRAAYADDRRAVGLTSKIRNNEGQAQIPESCMCCVRLYATKYNQIHAMWAAFGYIA